MVNYREEIMMKTSDNWHPNFENDMVEVSFMDFLPKEKIFRITVCGNDDDMMGIDLTDEDKAISIFSDIKKQNIITKDYLSKLGLEEDG